MDIKKKIEERRRRKEGRLNLYLHFSVPGLIRTRWKLRVLFQHQLLKSPDVL